MRRERYSKETVIAALRESHGMISPAAQKLGYTRKTLYDYIRRHHLEAVIDEEREAALDWAEHHLWKQIVDGNLTAIIFFLKCQGKRRGYVERPPTVQAPEPDLHDIDDDPDMITVHVRSGSNGNGNGNGHGHHGI